MIYQIKAGTVDVSVVIRIIDSTDGTPETGVVFNTAGIDLEYRRELAASTDITEATLAALTTAHADGGFLHIGNGYYRLDLPDAAVAAGATGVLVHGVVTGMVVIGCYIQLVAYDPFDTVRLGLTAMPNVASGSAGAIITSGTGTAQLSVTSGRANADMTHIATAAVSTSTAQVGANMVSGSSGAITATVMAADAIGASELAADAVTEIANAVWDTDATGRQTQGTFGQAIGDPVADTNTIYKAVVTDADGATVGVDVTNLPTNAELATSQAAADDATLAAIAALNNPSAATIADAVWDEDATAHQTQGTFGQAIGDPVADADTIWGLANTNLDATVSSRASQTSVDDLPTNAELATSQAAADDATLAAIAALTIPSAATNAAAVWDLDATGHQTQGTFGQAIGDPVADTNTLFKAVVTDAAGANVAIDVIAVKADTAAILVDTGTTLDAALAVVDANVDAILVDTGTTLDAALAVVDANVDSILDDTGTSGVALSAGAVDAILDEAIAEPSAAFAWPGSLRSIIGWVGALHRNRRTQTATTATLRDDANTGDISTATVSDDLTTTVHGEWS